MMSCLKVDAFRLNKNYGSRCTKCDLNPSPNGSVLHVEGQFRCRRGCVRSGFSLSKISTLTSISMGYIGFTVGTLPWPKTHDALIWAQGAIEFTAGTEASFFVQARDAYGNPLDEEALNWRIGGKHMQTNHRFIDRESDNDDHELF